MRRGAGLVVAVLMIVACGGSDAVVSKDGGGDGATLDGSNNGNDGGNGDGGSGDGAPNTDGASPDGTTEGGGALSLSCGNATCTLPGQSCCVDINGNQPVYACSSMACMQGTVSLQCASAADCPGNQVCCLDGTVDPFVAACSATCTGVDKAVLCDPNASAMTNRCGDAGACGKANIDTWGLSNKYGTCGDTMGPF